MPREIDVPDNSFSDAKRLNSGSGVSGGGNVSNGSSGSTTTIDTTGADESDLLTIVAGVARWKPLAIPDDSITNDMLGETIKIGDIDDLDTTDNSNIVAAINEVVAELGEKIEGEGANGFIPKFTGVNSIGNSRIDGNGDLGIIEILSQGDDVSDDRPLVRLGGEEIEASATGKILEAVGSGEFTVRFVNTGNGYAMILQGTDATSTSDALLKVIAIHGNHGIQSYMTGSGRAIRAEIVNALNALPAMHASTTGVGPSCFIDGSVQFRKRTITTASSTSDKNITVNDLVIEYNASGGTFTMVLPPAADFANRPLLFMNVANNATTIVIDGNGTETINGGGSINVASAYGIRRLWCTGTQWIIW